MSESLKKFALTNGDWCVAAVAYFLSIGLVCVGVWEFGRDYGKREQIAAFDCPTGEPGEVSKIVYQDGSVRCIYPWRKKWR